MSHAIINATAAAAAADAATGTAAAAATATSAAAATTTPTGGGWQLCERAAQAAMLRREMAAVDAEVRRVG